MALKTTKSALASVLLIGALAFTGCGAANEAKDAATSAISSAPTGLTQENKDALQGFMGEYTTAMLTSNITENADGVQQLSDLMDTSEISDANTTADVVKYINELPDEERKKIMDFIEQTDPLYSMTYHEGMSEGQKFVNSFVNIIAAASLEELGLGSEPTETAATLDMSQVTFDDAKGTALVPNAALSTAAADQDPDDETQQIDVIFKDGKWQLDGLASYERKAKAIDQA